MRGRDVLAGLFAAGMVACNSSPTAPSPPPAPSFSLAAGNYTLTLSVGVPPPSLPTGVACLEATTAADRAAIPVTVTVEGQGTLRIRPVAEADLGLVITLTPTSRNLLTGPIEGEARDPVTGVVASIVSAQSPPVFALPPPTVFGTLTTPSTATGVVSAQLRFMADGGSRLCLTNAWRLDPR